MLHIYENFSEVTGVNLVVFLRNRIDFEKYNFLGLDEKILTKIETIFNEQKNTQFKLSLMKENFEEVTFLFYLDISKNVHVFLGENVGIFGDKIAFYYEKDNILLDTIVLGKYGYENYKMDKKDLELSIICTDNIGKKSLEERLYTLKNITDCRDLVNAPPSDKTPDKYVDIVRNIKFKNTRVKILSYDEIKKLGLHLLDAVGKGSNYKPRMIILERMIHKNLPTIGLVGKGITFDSGGLNIKVGNGMDNMKYDMAGSATLLFTIKELDEKPLNCNIVCALPIAENSISGESYRPGDIIKSYSGKTVEIINTDAEGRLILADGISYISDNYTLDTIISIATLTGSCMHALGYNYAGIMGDNRQIVDSIKNNPTFEKYWELPLNNFYVEKTKGTMSDVKNLSEGMYAGATMGGAFLKNFCMHNEKFIHIDIAGVAFVKDKYGLYNAGATGFGVDSLSKVFLEYGRESE